jgi:hypothetical protein
MPCDTIEEISFGDGGYHHLRGADSVHDRPRPDAESADDMPPGKFRVHQTLVVPDGQRCFADVLLIAPDSDEPSFATLLIDAHTLEIRC